MMNLRVFPVQATLTTLSALLLLLVASLPASSSTPVPFDPLAPNEPLPICSGPIVRYSLPPHTDCLYAARQITVPYQPDANYIVRWLSPSTATDRVVSPVRHPVPYEWTSGRCQISVGWVNDEDRGQSAYATPQAIQDRATEVSNECIAYAHQTGGTVQLPGTELEIRVKIRAAVDDPVLVRLRGLAEQTAMDPTQPRETYERIMRAWWLYWNYFGNGPYP